MRRVLISMSIPAVLAIGIFVGGWLLQPKPRINQETLDGIKVGMTLSEVEATIGAPPGDYGVGKGEIEFWTGREPPRGKLRNDYKAWLGQTGAICVWFDANGKAADYEVFDVYREHDSNFDRLLAWLGLKAKNPQPVTKIE
jgi:hypothetical protein